VLIGSHGVVVRHLVNCIFVIDAVIIDVRCCLVVMSWISLLLYLLFSAVVVAVAIGITGGADVGVYIVASVSYVYGDVVDIECVGVSVAVACVNYDMYVVAVVEDVWVWWCWLSCCGCCCSGV